MEYLRYLDKSDAGKITRSKVKKALMLESFIDEQAEKIAWKAGETLPLLGKIKEENSVVVHSRKTGLKYVIKEPLATRILLEKI